MPKKTLTEVVGACFSHNHRHADEEKPHFCSHRRSRQEAKARDRPTPLITLIKMEDAVLVDKITKMQNQKEVEGGRAVAAGDPQRPPRQARARDEVPRARRHGGGGAFRELCMIRV